MIPSAMSSHAHDTDPSLKPLFVLTSLKNFLDSSPKPTFEPNLLPSKVPTLKPTNKSTHPRNHRTLSFYVMGDVPYTTNEMKLLKNQLKDMAQTSKDDALFMVHVGDIYPPNNVDCVSSSYSDVVDIFTGYSNLPVLILSGDNGWTDCEIRDVAWTLWSRNFMGFEQKWNSTNNIPNHVTRQ